MNCIFRHPFSYSYSAHGMVAINRGPYPVTEANRYWPPPPSVFVLFCRQRAEFYRTRVMYPWGGQIPRTSEDLSNYIYRDGVPLWVPKPQQSLTAMIEQMTEHAERATAKSAHQDLGMSNEQELVADAVKDLPADPITSINISVAVKQAPPTVQEAQLLETPHVGDAMALSLLEDADLLPDWVLLGDQGIAVYKTTPANYGQGDAPIRWLGNGHSAPSDVWRAPANGSTDRAWTSRILEDTLVHSVTSEAAMTALSHSLESSLDTSGDLSFIYSPTETSMNLMTPRIESDMLPDRSEQRIKGINEDGDEDETEEELIVLPRRWGLSAVDLAEDSDSRTQGLPTPPRSSTDETVQPADRSRSQWKANQSNSHTIALSSTVSHNYADGREFATSREDEVGGDGGGDDEDGSEGRDYIDDYDDGDESSHAHSPPIEWLYEIVDDYEGDHDTNHASQTDSVLSSCSSFGVEIPADDERRIWKLGTFENDEPDTTPAKAPNRVEASPTNADPHSPTPTLIASTSAERTSYETCGEVILSWNSPPPIAPAIPETNDLPEDENVTTSAVPQIPETARRPSWLRRFLPATSKKKSGAILSKLGNVLSRVGLGLSFRRTKP